MSGTSVIGPCYLGTDLWWINSSVANMNKINVPVQGLRRRIQRDRQNGVGLCRSTFRIQGSWKPVNMWKSRDSFLTLILLSLSNAGSIICVKINAESYFPNVENSIIWRLPIRCITTWKFPLFLKHLKKVQDLRMYLHNQLRAFNQQIQQCKHSSQLSSSLSLSKADLMNAPLSRYLFLVCSGAHRSYYPMGTGGPGGNAAGAWSWPLTSNQCRG
jgi:hypothetical protein